jgi:iduronate 2-sulfatase
MSLFEESSRVPLVIAAPGVSKPGTTAAAPVGLIDLYPTLAELCDVKPADNIQGQSLVPMLRDVSVTGRGWTLSEVQRGGGGGGKRKGASPNVGGDGERVMGYTLRTQRWRYTEWDEGRKGRELYDHEADPKEITNLADLPAHAETIKTLSAQLRDAAKSTFPADGKIPALGTGMWAPNLTDP